MLKLGVFLCVLGIVLAGPPVSRSRQEIESFRAYLESGRTGHGIRLEQRMAANPKASAWENSGKFQGDILLDEEQVSGMVQEFAMGRNAYIWPNTKWPGDVIPFEFAIGHFTASERLLILEGIRDIEARTCVRFRARTSADSNYVLLTNWADGCYAHVGYWPTRGVHIYNLGPGCFLHTTIVHEWLHILGFLHMQSTHNRDDYVQVMWQNIWPGMEHNFDIYGTNVVDNLDLPYEYTSCMHYGPYGFTINGQPTLVPIREFDGVMGQQQFVTDLDWLRANRHYNCPGAWD